MRYLCKFKGHVEAVKQLQGTTSILWAGIKLVEHLVEEVEVVFRHDDGLFHFLVVVE